MFKKFLLFSFIILSCSGCSVQNNEKPVNENNYIENKIEAKKIITEHPIDTELEKCIEKNSTNSGMIDCSHIAIDGWNAEIKNHLDNLKSILPPEQFALVQNSQDKWEKYKNEELNTLKKLVYEHDGREYQVSYFAEYVGLLKERATLLGYYEYIYSETDNEQ